MLKLVETQADIGVATCTHRWHHDLKAIGDIVENAFRTEHISAGFYPHPDESRLQNQLLRIPALNDLRTQLFGSGLKAVIINTFGLIDLSPTDRNTVLYATALSLGFPTSTDQLTRRVLWDVKARPGMENQDASASRFLTFSEKTGRADMHTDSSFFPMPEEHFILYTVRSARCGGGRSCLVDVEDVLTTLAESRSGRTALKALTEPIPFCIPTAFASQTDITEIGMYPVFAASVSESPGASMRWRHDAIIKGFQARPDLAKPPLITSVDIVHDLVEKHVPGFTRHLEDDTLLWADNHRMLNGHTHYEDPDRHLIRIRMSRVPNAERIGPSGLSSD